MAYNVVVFALDRQAMWKLIDGVHISSTAGQTCYVRRTMVDLTTSKADRVYC